MTKLPVAIFCSVIDNFGDAGVAYRLAKILSQQAKLSVSFFIDDLTTLSQLEPKVWIKQNKQTINRINIIKWHGEKLDSSFFTENSCILEMFGCFSEKQLVLPHLLQQLVINIEYLSAEAWIASCHLKPSLISNQNKYFYFLGFQPDSGGLIREADYLKKQQMFLTQHNKQSDFLEYYQIKPTADKKIIFIFGYQTDIWIKWIETWNTIGLSFQLWIAGNNSDQALQAYLSATPNLDYKILPFVKQADFDKLLWLADINIVRGEDSFVRAQYAQKPFFWHIYPQQQQTHIDKLNAFWQLCYPFYNAEIQTHHQLLSNELNQVKSLTNNERLTTWRFLIKNLTTWQQGCQNWQNYLFSQQSANEKLTHFIKKQLK